MNILLSDFYSPWEVPRLYQQLFPDRWYEQKSSRNVLYQTIFEIRKKLKNENSCFEIRWKNNFIYLTSSKDWKFNFKIKNPSLSLNSVGEFKNQQLLLELKNKFKNNYFSIEDLLSQTKLPKRTLQRYLKTLIEKEHLMTKGQGKATQYRLI